MGMYSLLSSKFDNTSRHLRFSFLFNNKSKTFLVSLLTSFEFSTSVKSLSPYHFTCTLITLELS